MYYTYIMRCEGDKLYTGITTNIVRRFSEHASRNGRGAKFTRSHTVSSVAALWSSPDRSIASRLEYRIKQLTRKQKLALIDGLVDINELFGAELAEKCRREPVPPLTIAPRVTE